jgi:hypothetical protein
MMSFEMFKCGGFLSSRLHSSQHSSNISQKKRSKLLMALKMMEIADVI